MFYLILILLLLLFFVVFVFYRFVNTKKLKNIFYNNLGVVLCGNRGKGKDVTFAYLVHNKKHNSNIYYNDKTNIIKLSDLGIPNLSRNSLIDNNFNKVPYSQFECFNNITFISDVGLYFPNYDDVYLNKTCSNIATTYTIWRHLYDSPCNFNLQKNGRLWKKLREQIECVVEIQKINILPFYIKIKYRYFERPQDCENGLKPLSHKKGIFRQNDFAKVENSKRGDIYDFTCIIPKRYLKYDSHIFRKLVFDFEK